MFTRTLLASAIALSSGLWAGPVLGETSPAEVTDTTNQIGKITEWIGREVNDQQGKSVGEIVDFAVNLQDASIPFAVIQLDSMFNSKSIAVPLSALRADPSDDSKVSLAASEAQWKAAKTFDNADWPSSATLQAGTAVAAGPATASATGQTGREAAMKEQDGQFEKLDQNGDGYLSATEIKPRAGLSVTRDSDTNHDGRIDRAEFSAFEANEASKHDTDRSTEK